MKLDDQVCSLELAKRLKELGVKSDTLMMYVEQPWIVSGDKVLESRIFIRNNDPSYPWGNEIDWWAAFTIAELLELLPDLMEDPDEDDQTVHLFLMKGELYNVSYGFGGFNKNYEEKKASDALAKMLIYLIENSLIEIAK